MTTIACNGKILATDNQLTSENTKSFTYKLWVVGDSAYAGAGDFNSIVRFMRWTEESSPKDRKPEFRSGSEEETEDFTVIELKITGEKIYWDKTLTPWTVVDRFFIGGSGGDMALAVMQAGKGPIEAVYIASQIDAASGYGVSWVEINEEGEFELNFEDVEISRLKIPKRYKGR